MASKPCNYVFKKQALNDRLREVKKVVDGKNGLNEIVFSGRKVVRRCVDFKGLVVHADTEAIQRHFQEILPLLRIEITTGRFEVVNRIAIIGQDVTAVFGATFPAGVAEGVMVPGPDAACVPGPVGAVAGFPASPVLACVPFDGTASANGPAAVSGAGCDEPTMRRCGLTAGPPATRCSRILPPARTSSDF